MPRSELSRDAVRFQAPASLRRRLAAFSVDYVFIAGYLVLLTVAAIRVPWASTLFDNPVSGQAAGFVLVTLPVVLYFTLWERSRSAATPGKRALGIAVLRSDGRRLTGSRSLARNALKFAPWELAHTCIWRMRADSAPPAWVLVGLVIVWLLVLLNVVVALRSERRQAVYDRIVDSVVYRVREDALHKEIR